jgi:O-antigen/teichoic acid export membrane protein
LGRVALACGLFLAIVVAGGAPAWQRFFNTASAWPFVILGVGLPLYLVQGVDRGTLQGQLAFRRLAWSYQSEMWVRLLAGVALVVLGLAVNGAVAALVLSFFAAWIVVRRGASPGERLNPTARRAVLAFAAPVLLVQLSQIAVNNSDVLLVKRLFTAAEAGQYAALALIGRIVFFATGAIVTVLFPIVARRAGRDERHRHLLGLALAIVVVVSVPIIAAVALAPRQVITLFFGPAYLAAAPYLWVYAAATALYALTNVFVNYHLALGRSGGAWLTLLGGILQIALILGRHHDFGAVVLMQLAAMSVLLLAVLAWDGWLVRAARRAGPVPDREAALLHV